MGALAMGSRTYAFVLEHGGAWPYAERPCFVFTHRELPAIAGPNLRFVRGEVAGLRDELLTAAGGKHLWLVGGGELAAQFQRAGMLDELWLSVIPVVLGGGAALFGGARIPALQLQGVKSFQRGIVELRYALG